MKKSQLEIKVFALNTLNVYAEKVIKAEKEKFAKFIGKDIFKVNGDLKEKYNLEKESFIKEKQGDYFVDIHYWRDLSYKNFSVRFKICVNGGSYDVKPATAFCHYEEINETIYQIDKENLLIENSNTPREFKTYNEAEILKAANECKKAAEIYEKALNKVDYQFRDIVGCKGLRN